MPLRTRCLLKKSDLTSFEVRFDDDELVEKKISMIKTEICSDT